MGRQHYEDRRHIHSKLADDGQNARRLGDKSGYQVLEPWFVGIALRKQHFDKLPE